MAEVKYKVCDRCGRKMEYKGWTSKFFGIIKEHNKFKVRKIYCGNPSGYDYSDYNIELCEKCTEQLMSFLYDKALAEMKGE